MAAIDASPRTPTRSVLASRDMVMLGWSMFVSGAPASCPVPRDKRREAASFPAPGGQACSGFGLSVSIL